MKNEALYNKTVDILVQAYFNDTLEHSNCMACAVGNIICGNMGDRYKLEYFFLRGDRNVWVNGLAKRSVGWSSVFITSGNVQTVNLGNLEGEALRQIECTGYSCEQLSRIEYAFETADGNKGNDLDPEWMFNGLMAVIDALDIIHENTDTDLTTTIKRKFNKQKLIPQ